jgi:hypothetical protein
VSQSVATDVLAIDTSTITTVAPLVVVAIVGISLIVRALRSHSARSAAVSWMEVPGTVLMSTIQVQRSGNSRHEIPLVVYSYQVNGMMLQGNRVRVGDELGRARVAGTASSAAQTIARYPVGAAVRVLCNPANPAESALER